MVAPDAKLMAVNEVPTELPPDSTSIPETTPDRAAPSPQNAVALTIPVDPYTVTPVPTFKLLVDAQAVIPVPTFKFPLNVPIPLNDAAPAPVIVAPILTAGLPAKNPPRAVTTPTESIFVTSSCVNVPPIETFH